MSTTDQPKSVLMGVKIDLSVLDENGKTIQDVVNMLGLTVHYVIGKDQFHEGALEVPPHYHIHFSFNGEPENVQTRLKDLGTSTKCYQANHEFISDPHHWYAYAVKENELFVSDDIDKAALDIQSIIQREFRRQHKYPLMDVIVSFDEEKMEWISGFWSLGK